MKGAQAVLLVALGLLAFSAVASAADQYAVPANCIPSSYTPPTFENTGVSNVEKCYRSTCSPDHCSIVCEGALFTGTPANPKALKPDALKVWVTDTGIGNTPIDEDKPERIYFYASQVFTDTDKLNIEQAVSGTGTERRAVTITQFQLENRLDKKNETDGTYYKLTYVVRFPRTDPLANCSRGLKNWISGAAEFLNPVLNSGNSDAGVNCVADTGSTNVDTPTPAPTKKLYAPQNVEINLGAFSYAVGYPATVSWTNSDATYAKAVDYVPSSPDHGPEGVQSCPFKEPPYSKNFTGTTDRDYADIDNAVSPQSINYLCPGSTYTVIVSACTSAPLECVSSTTIKAVPAVAPTKPLWQSAAAGAFSFPLGTWTDAKYNASAYDGGARVNKYIVTVTPVGTEVDCPNPPHSKATTVTTFKHVNETSTWTYESLRLDVAAYLCPGNQYTLTVEACNAVGCSGQDVFLNAGGVGIDAASGPGVDTTTVAVSAPAAH
eukprot:tig00021221_g19356.t1